MGFGSTLADIILGGETMGMVRKRQDDKKLAEFYSQYGADPTTQIPQGLNDPDNVVKLRDFMQKDEIKRGMESIYPQLAQFAMPNQSSGIKEYQQTPQDIADAAGTPYAPRQTVTKAQASPVGRQYGQTPTLDQFTTDAMQYMQSEGLNPRFALPVINQLKEQGSFQAPAAVPKVENFGGMPFVVDGQKVSLAEGFTPKTDPFKYQERDLPVSRDSIQKQEMLPDGTWRNIGVPLQKWERSQTTGGDGGRVGPGGKTPKSKVLPPSVVKLQQEAVDQLSIASNTEKDLTDIVSMLDDPKLDLGPVDNLTSKGLNYLGMSTDNSRTYGTLVATIEKLRNDSLKLNKGVQTDGDAIRAMNEIIANPNDKAYVKQRLQTIARANKRWADIQQGHIKNIRDNYDLEQLDVTGQRQPENVINPPQEQVAPAGIKAKLKNGKTVTSDGKGGWN